MPPIRVGFVVHVMQVAGAEMLVSQIIDQLQDRVTATVYCLDKLGLLGEQLLAKGVPVVVLDRKPGLDWSLGRRIAKDVNARRIDILHAQQYTPFFYSALARIVSGRRFKILLTEHGRHFPDIVSWKRRFVNRWLLSRYANLSTACCDFSARALEANDGFRHVLTIPNGVDFRQLKSREDTHAYSELRNKLGLESDRPYVVCVARFHPIKDHPTLVRAWSQVHKRLPEARLLFVGDGPERNTIQQLCTSLGLNDSVQFLGIRHDVGDILRASNVFTLTSLSEASSLTLLEAMASQCPPVVTNVGGNAEHLTDGIEGLLVDRGNSDQLALAILDLLTHPEKANSMGILARKRVLGNFDLIKTIDRYYELYGRLVARSEKREARD